MESLVLTIHYIICFFLIITILLQAGKGADIGAVFGGASQTVFGGRGPATFLNKVTTIVAILFLTTSIWLSAIAKNQGSRTVIDQANISPPAKQETPTTPVETETEKKTDEKK